MAGMTPIEFAVKWMGSTTTESAAAQEHFIDLCRMVGVPTPNEADPDGKDYAFEKGAEKQSGGDGFADVIVGAFSDRNLGSENSGGVYVYSGFDFHLISHLARKASKPTSTN